MSVKMKHVCVHPAGCFRWTEKVPVSYPTPAFPKGQSMEVTTAIKCKTGTLHLCESHQAF